jgi:hypothetical protein
VIDLNRLREATDSGWTQFENHGDTMVAMPRERFDGYHQTSRAVLESPHVWWCATDMRGDAKPIPNTAAMVATRGRCGGCGKIPASSGCGWVALVPITGEDR